MLGDLAVVHSHDVDGFKMDSSTGRRHTQECSLVSPLVRLVSRHELPVGGLPMDLCPEVWEWGTKVVVKPPDAVLIRSGVWLGRMVDEVVSEELLEDVEVPAALHFFGIAADDSLRRFGMTYYPVRSSLNLQAHRLIVEATQAEISVHLSLV